MSDANGEGTGLEEGLESSEGDPRVLVVMNAVLSTTFALMVVSGASLIGALEFRYTTIAGMAIVLFVLTHVMTRP